MDTPTTGSHISNTANGQAPRPKMPRWVKVFLVIAMVLVSLLVVALLSGGEHGPGRHFSAPGIVSGMTAADLQ